jgi:hypothetical protein
MMMSDNSRKVLEERKIDGWWLVVSGWPFAIEN